VLIDAAAVRVGRVSSVVPPIVNVRGVSAAVGQSVQFLGKRAHPMFGEVVALTDNDLQILPFGSVEGLSHDTRVQILDQRIAMELRYALPGTVVDGFGQPVPGFSEQKLSELAAIDPVPAMKLLDRIPIEQQMLTGVRSLDVCTPFAVGQRVVIQAPAGVGKTSLLNMLLRGAQADRIVFSLVGERTREAVELISTLKQTNVFSKSTIVLSTSDRSSVERAKAPELAIAVAQLAARRGERVLLLIDSITRYCRALREIALSLGETPTRRGYPSSVFTALPKLFEQAGNFNYGSITLVCTVLVEDDLTPDPIAEEVQSLVDGHICLSRDLAAQGHYPAIDILKSISRLASAVSDKKGLALSSEIRACLAAQKQNEVLIRMGEYAWGNDTDTDRRLKAFPKVMKLLCQDGVSTKRIDEVKTEFAKALV
jgi:ATP synthase in type III secretion protein N